MKDIDNGFKNLTKFFNKNKELKLQVGLFKEAGMNEEKYISEYAYLNEFGIGVPSRPFMRRTFDTENKKWQNLIEKNLKKVSDNQIDIETLLVSVADMAIDDIKKTISSNMPPPNSEKTIQRKKSSKTLIDTGIMRSSIDYRVVK
jgi:hypothetical protein